MAVVFPGQPLGSNAEFLPGLGTHLFGGHVCASVVGAASEVKSSSLKANGASQGQKEPNADSSHRPTLSVTRNEIPSLLSGAETNVLPAVDSTVLARVTRINPRQATVEILVVGDTVCADGFQGLVRVQDVRATEKDKVKIAESFRPGDIVRAVVISLGDQSNYYLSTASNLLGVVMATSDAGNAMYPISWKEFRDPVTGASESRKVAKPF